MPCQHHKDALIEAAAAGGTPQGELRAHLDECASCGAAFAEEQSLFAAIDSGLHAKSNSEVPPSLLTRVRVGLNEAEARRLRWVPPLVFASASVALVLLFLFMLQPHQRTPVNVAQKSPVVAPTAKQRGPDINSERVLPPARQIASVRATQHQSARNSTIPHSAASGNLEVLVPPDEREGLAQLVATLNQHRDVAVAFLAERPESKDSLVTVDPLQIPDIEIKPLDGTESGTSDGAGEKHR